MISVFKKGINCIPTFKKCWSISDGVN